MIIINSQGKVVEPHLQLTSKLLDIMRKEFMSWKNENQIDVMKHIVEILSK